MTFYSGFVEYIKQYFFSGREINPEETGEIASKMSWFTGVGLEELINKNAPCLVQIKSNGISYDVSFRKTNLGIKTGVETI